MILSILVIGACTFALGIIPFFWTYLSIIGIVGLSLPVFNTPFIVLLQQKVAGDFLGRVFGVLGTISSCIMPMAMLFYGPLADLLKIEWLLIGTGLLMLTEGIMMIKTRALIEAGKQ